MPVALHRLALAACALPLLLLCACAEVDPDEARICRLVAVALADGTPTILRQGRAASPEGVAEVRIDYQSGSPARRGFVQCRFAPHQPGLGRPDLQSVRDDTGPLSDPRLFVLRRFWLDTPEADRADPDAIQGARSALRLPAGAAYFLQALLNALPASATYGLLAAAYSLVYGLVGRINLAFGELAAVGGAGALAGAALVGRDTAGELVVAAVAGAVWAASLHGFAIGRAVFLPLRRSSGQQGLVATVGLALVLNEYLRLAQGQTPVWIPPLRTAPIAVARSGDFIVTVTPLSLLLALGFFVVAGGVLALLEKTQFGRNWRAIADDPRAAALMGVSPTQVFSQTFGLASALAGASGATVVLVYGSFGTTLGATLGLKALLAAVLGGIGSVPGAFVGGLGLGLFEAGWSALYPIDYRDLATFVVLAAALVLRPGGILGYPDLTPRRI